jgi:hypothetical protein
VGYQVTKQFEGFLGSERWEKALLLIEARRQPGHTYGIEEVVLEAVDAFLASESDAIEQERSRQIEAELERVEAANV